MEKIAKKGMYKSTFNADEYEVNADNVPLYTKEGNDNVSFIGGKKNKVNTGAGDDAIVVEKGFVEKVVGGFGDDKIGILSVAKKVYGNAGNDTLYVGANGRVSRLDGGIGNDTITVEGFTGKRQISKLYGGKGNDVISLLDGGSVGTAYGGAGKDNFIVQGPSYYAGTMKLDGGVGSDTFEFKNVNSNYNDNNTIFHVTGGKGNNILNVFDSNVRLNYIGNTGIDKVYISDGTINGKIMGGSNNDVFNVDGLNNEFTLNNNSVSLYGEQGTDSFTVNDSIIDVLDAGSGSDTINLKSSYVNGLIANAGNDIITAENTAIEYFDVGSGNDTIQLKNSGFFTGDLGAGDDVIEFNIRSDSVYQLDIDNIEDYSILLNAGSGNDIIRGCIDTKYTNENCQYHWINLNKGNDTIHLFDSLYVCIDTGVGVNNLKFDGYLVDSSIYADKSTKNVFSADDLFNVNYFGSEKGIDMVGVKQIASSYFHLDNGNDVFSVEESRGGNTIDVGSGNDIICVAPHSYVIDDMTNPDKYYAGDGNDTFYLKNTSDSGDKVVELYGGDGKDIYDISGFVEGVTIKDYEPGDIIRINTDMVNFKNDKPMLYSGKEYGVGSFDGRFDCGLAIEHAQLMSVTVETYNHNGVTGQYVLKGKYA